MEDRLREHLRSVPVDLADGEPERIIATARRRSSRTRAVGLGAGVAIAAGVLFGAAALRDRSSVVDVAQSAASTVATADSADAAVSAEDGAPSALPESSSEPAGEAEFAMATAGSGFDPLSPSSLIGLDDGFVGLRVVDGAVVVVRSDDGLTYTEAATSGFPADETVVIGDLVHDDGVFAALVLGSGDTEALGSVAVSTDLVSWSLAPLESPGEAGGFVQALAIRGSTVVAAGASFPDFVDPTIAALEFGAISQADFERSCGVIWDGPTDPIEVLACDSDMPLATIEPGADLHAPLFEAIQSGEAGGGLAVWTGEAGEPFTAQELPTGGFASPVIAVVESGFVLADVADGRPVVRTSTDGLVWSDPVVASEAWTQLAAVADRAAGVEVVAGAFVATPIELDRTPAEETVGDGVAGRVVIPVGDGTEEGWINGVATGPAGVAVLIELSPATPDPPAGDEVPEKVTLTVDGYTLVTGLESGPFTVTGPDGSVIHDFADASIIIGDAQDVDGVARFEGPDDERLVILDPDTGEDLFAITQDQFIQAIGLERVTSQFPEGRRMVVLFSPDAIEWRILDGAPVVEDGFVTLEAVGDDEVLVRIDRFLEPPDAYFAVEGGAEPSPDEAEAIAEWEQAQRDAVEVVRIPVG